MKKPSVHARAVQQPHGAGITVWQHRLRPELGRNGIQPFGDSVESLVPADTGEAALTLRPDALLWIQQPVGCVLPVQIPRHLAAQESARHRMIRISTQAGPFSVIYIDEQRTCVGAVEGTD